MSNYQVNVIIIMYYQIKLLGISKNNNRKKTLQIQISSSFQAKSVYTTAN